MPHIIVDGYNIIRRIPHFLSAERKGLESGRYALLLALEEYAAAFGYRVTVVFDAGGRPLHLDAAVPRAEKFAGIDIIFSARGESADTAIEKLLAEIRNAKSDGLVPFDEAQVVVSDDLAIRDVAIEHGAFARSADELFDSMKAGKRLFF